VLTFELLAQPLVSCCNVVRSAHFQHVCLPKPEQTQACLAHLTYVTSCTRLLAHSDTRFTCFSVTSFPFMNKQTNKQTNTLQLTKRRKTTLPPTMLCCCLPVYRGLTTAITRATTATRTRLFLATARRYQEGAGTDTVSFLMGVSPTAWLKRHVYTPVDIHSTRKPNYCKRNPRHHHCNHRLLP
jgi:hypothetical protein